MGGNLKRLFLSFSNLIRPERLSAIKVFTNDLEEKVRVECGQSRRVLNVDPGYLTVSALVMATTKDFSHRIPLEYGIYAHLEFLFSKTGIRVLDWTYPDFRKEDYRQFFLSVRKLYMTRLKEMGLG
jgi:hypothetical protein